MAADAGYLNILRGWDDDALRIAAEQVEGLRAHPGWLHLLALLGVAEQNALNRLLGSAFNDKVLEQAEYSRLLGVLAGIKQPQVAADSFAAALEKLRQRDNESPA